MGFGRGMLLWIWGVPIPIVVLLALFCTPRNEGARERPWTPGSQ